MPRNWLTIYPALAAAIVQVVESVVLAFGIHPDLAQSRAIQAVSVAALGLIVAAFTRPFSYSAVTGFLLAAGTVLVSWHVPFMTPAILEAFVALAAAFGFKAVHRAVTPAAGSPVRPAPGA